MDCIGWVGSCFSVAAGKGQRRSRERSLVKDLFDMESVKLGSGSFGSVSRASCKLSGRVVAVKAVSRYLQSDAAIAGEVAIMQAMDHRNILKLYSQHEEANLAYISMELCAGGDLYDRLQEQGGVLPEVKALNILRQLFEGVAYMHSQGFAHRDLKLENMLLLDDRPLEFAVLKICDFGLAARIELETGRLRSIQNLCTLRYAAPEALSSRCDARCDIWSCGVIMQALLSGCLPSIKDMPADLSGKRALAWLHKRSAFRDADLRAEGVSNAAIGLIRGLLCKDRELRYSAEDALAHPWLRMKSPLASLAKFLEDADDVSTQGSETDVRDLDEDAERCRIQPWST